MADDQVVANALHISEDLRGKIFAEIAVEREHQIRRWGTEVDDRKNGPNDWIAYIAHYATQWFKGEFRPYSKGTGAAFRANMVKVAATAVAAIESHDRQVLLKGKPHYEV